MLSEVKTLIEKLSRTFGTYFRDVFYVDGIFDSQTFLDIKTASYLAFLVDDDIVNFTIIICYWKLDTLLKETWLCIILGLGTVRVL